jgi:Na+/alanine symporter
MWLLSRTACCRNHCWLPEELRGCSCGILVIGTTQQVMQCNAIWFDAFSHCIPCLPIFCFMFCFQSIRSFGRLTNMTTQYGTYIKTMDWRSSREDSPTKWALFILYLFWLAHFIRRMVWLTRLVRPFFALAFFIDWMCIILTDYNEWIPTKR